MHINTIMKYEPDTPVLDSPIPIEIGKVELAF